MINLKAVEEAKTKEYRHFFDGLNGTRCGHHSIKISSISLSWDSVTCPSCRTLKQEWEPESRDIITKGD